MSFRTGGPGQGPPPPSGDPEEDAFVRGYESAAQRERLREGIMTGHTEELREYVRELRDVQMNPIALERIFVDLYETMRAEEQYTVGEATNMLRSIVSPG